MPKVGGRRKKHKTHVEIDKEQEENTPKSFVFRRGKVSTELKESVGDMRKCMYPNTAMNLQDSSNLKLSSFVRAAKHYKVSHLMAFHTKANKNYVRFIKTNGPALTFRIVNFCRARDIINNLKQSQSFLRDMNSPLLVMNNFGDKNNPQIKHMRHMIQGMFPALNMSKVKTQHLKRVISFTYNEDNGCVYFRNYRIKITNAGLGKNIQQLLETKTANLSGFNNFSEYLNSQKSDQVPSSREGKGKQTIRLYEVGPRLKLKYSRYDEVLDLKVTAEQEQDRLEEENQGNEVYAQQNENQYEGMEYQRE